MDGIKVRLAIKHSNIEKTKAGNEGQRTIRPAPAMSRHSPMSIPALRPLLSATEARKGPRIPDDDRRVTANESVCKSTPRPRPKAGRNGYTMRTEVLITVRAAMKARIWVRRGCFNAFIRR